LLGDCYHNLDHIAKAIEYYNAALEIAREEGVDDVSQDLRDLEGLTPELIAKLAEHDIHTRDDLGDLAVDELVEMTGIDEEKAKTLIMKAREHWFTAEATAAPEATVTEN